MLRYKVSAFRRAAILKGGQGKQRAPVRLRLDDMAEEHVADSKPLQKDIDAHGDENLRAVGNK